MLCGRRPSPPNHARAERRLDALVATPAAHPAGRELQTAVKAWRTKYFVFLEDPDVPATNNAREREIRPSCSARSPEAFARMGRAHPRRMSIRHQHCPDPPPSRAAGHRPAPRQNLRANPPSLIARDVSSYPYFFCFTIVPSEAGETPAADGRTLGFIPYFSMFKAAQGWYAFIRSSLVIIQTAIASPGRFPNAVMAAGVLFCLLHRSTNSSWVVGGV
ncbi:MAG: transposase [Defluviicoccus sp.]|nr:MAG: transposase [Defluviicoccus sp.]